MKRHLRSDFIYGDKMGDLILIQYVSEDCTTVTLEEKSARWL